MKLKPIYVAVASLILSQSIFAETKNLDFYPSGANRYSISGKVKELNLPTSQNSILITNANSDAYVRLNNQAPYHLNLIESDLNLYQIIEFNKGKLINYKGNQVKLISAQGDKVIAEYENNIIFIPLNEISIPKTFLNDTQKGLKASFVNSVGPEDNLYFSQAERQLNYKNTYESIIKGDNIHLAHYLNITNSSPKTFENVYLTFFLSETNIQERMYPVAPMAMAKGMVASADMAASLPPPTFENDSVQNLKNISIKEPMTIYPNFNKIKYSEKTYKIDQFAKLSIDDKYDIYLGDELEDKANLKDLKTPGTPTNIVYLRELESLKDSIKHSIILDNKINVVLDKNDVLPSGKLDIYESVKNQDKLIVSTNIGHTENKNLEIFKSRNNDLSVIDVNFEIIDNLSLKLNDKSKRVILKLKDIQIENKGSEPYVINLNGKKTSMGPNSTIRLLLN